jgi:hypothetical protein
MNLPDIYRWNLRINFPERKKMIFWNLVIY